MRVVTNVPVMSPAPQGVSPYAERFDRGTPGKDDRLLDVKKGDTVSISEEAKEKLKASEAFRNQVKYSQGIETTIQVERSSTANETVIDAKDFVIDGAVFGDPSSTDAKLAQGGAAKAASDDDTLKKAQEALQKAQQELEKAQTVKAQAETPQEQAAADARVMAATQKVAMAMSQLTQASAPEM